MKLLEAKYEISLPWSPLEWAAGGGSREAVLFLLDRKLWDGKPEHPVDERLHGDMTALIVAAERARPEVFALLLERGAAIGAKDLSGRKALIDVLS